MGSDAAAAAELAALDSDSLRLCGAPTSESAMGPVQPPRADPCPHTDLSMLHRYELNLTKVKKLKKVFKVAYS